MRKLMLPTIIIIGGSLLVIRLFYLQIINDTFKLKSVNNAIKINYDYPERGYIYDRNGELMVANQPSFDIMVTPRDIKNLDTLSFCTLLNITKEEFIKKITKAKVYSPMLRSVFLAQLNKTEFAAFQEKVRKFPGFEIQKRSLRDYQIEAGANVFGFITQVNDKIIIRMFLNNFIIYLSNKPKNIGASFYLIISQRTLLDFETREFSNLFLKSCKFRFV